MAARPLPADSVSRHPRHQRHATRGGVAYQTVALWKGPARASVLRRTRPRGPRPPGPSPPLPRMKEKGRGGVKPTLRQTCLWPKPGAQFAFKDSMVHIICNSHYVSHFAAFFIVTGTKISVVESCLWLCGRASRLRPPLQSRFELVQVWPARSPADLPPEGQARAGSGPHDLLARDERPVATGRPPPPAGACAQPAEPVLWGDRNGYRSGLIDSMILPQVHLRKPCYDFSFL